MTLKYLLSKTQEFFQSCAVTNTLPVVVKLVPVTATFSCRRSGSLAGISRLQSIISALVFVCVGVRVCVGKPPTPRALSQRWSSPGYRDK